MRCGISARFYLAKQFAKTFYSSKAWQDCRNEYARSRGHLCERCAAKGLIVPGEIVHHKIYIDASNINDESVTMNFDNLELLCRDCHAEEHSRGERLRYEINRDGSIRISSPL